MLNQVKSSSRASSKKAPPLKAKKTAEKSPASRKKATKEKPNLNLAKSFVEEVDKAHAPGHTKLNLRDESAPKTGVKNQPMNASAQNRLRPADDIRRKQSPIRRNGPIGQNTK